MEFDHAKGTLVEEGRELLTAMEDALLEIEKSGYSEELINAIFRAAHTIKGSAGLLGLNSLVNFTHIAESLLDMVRNGERTLDGAMMSLLLTSSDYINTLLDAIENGTEEIEPNPDLRQHLIEQMNDIMGAKPKAEATPATVIAADVTAETHINQDPLDNECWHISFRPNVDVLRNGLDPLSFIRYLNGVGEIVHIYTIMDTLPKPEDFDAENNYLGFEITLNTDKTKQDIENAFSFILDDCQLLIKPPHSEISEYIELLNEIPEKPERLGSILVKIGALTENELEKILAIQAATEEPQRKAIGTIIVEQQITSQEVVSAALKKQQKIEEKVASEQVFIKVEVSKLDMLINLVGELVIAGASAGSALKQRNIEHVIEANEEVASLVERIRDATLSLRMVAIGEVFKRFPRVIRDVSKDLGKEIELVITGAETELDKSMVEKLSDPLMHIVRNAMDHGIENAETRIANDKPPFGTLRLNAYHESGSIVIEVSDDGKGLDKNRITEKAIEKGIISPDKVLTEAEIFNLIFEPGFSTAEKVTNLSGRGVGMDVVKRNIEQLRGEIDIISKHGQGTTVRIRLPLTLAIIDGFQVKVADETFVLPLEQVVECIDLKELMGLHEIVNLRGNPLPYIRLRDIFSLEAKENVRESVIVLQFGQQRAGVVVDQLVGEFQAVIKPLGQIFVKNKILSGSTILGNGNVALILDVPNLIQTATKYSFEKSKEKLAEKNQKAPQPVIDL